MGALAFVSGMTRFAILSVLLSILLSVFCSLRSGLSLYSKLCALCNFDATQKRNMRIYLAHICLPPGVAHMHTVPPTPHQLKAAHTRNPRPLSGYGHTFLCPFHMEHY